MDHAGPAGRPSLESIFAAAEELVPALRERARQTELDRRVSDEMTERARKAGLFRLMQPARYGGYEYGFGPFTEVNRITGWGCGSSSWCFSLGMVHQWLLALFPHQAQEDVWADDPDAMTAVSYAPAGSLRACPGGWMASGKWSWLSNVDNAQWVILGCFLPAEDGGKPTGGFILAPRADYRIVDDWHAVGLAGTGSKSIEMLGEQFVPAHRHLTFAQASGGAAPGTQVNPNPLYRVPFLASVPLCLATPALGIVEGALDQFIDWTSARSTRGAVAGGGNRMAEFAQVQSRVAEAAACLDAAHLLVKRDIEDVEGRVAAGSPVDAAARLRNRRDHAFCARLAVQAADALFQATGGAGLMLDSPIQRAWRDAHAIARHVSLNWDAVSTMYGQHRLGLEPRGQY
jgi:alkylation response protein AidB-like acyl-CoA dehydrogenase